MTALLAFLQDTKPGSSRSRADDACDFIFNGVKVLALGVAIHALLAWGFSR